MHEEPRRGQNLELPHWMKWKDFHFEDLRNSFAQHPLPHERTFDPVSKNLHHHRRSRQKWGKTLRGEDEKVKRSVQIISVFIKMNAE